MRGRRPKPTWLKLKMGTPNPGRLNYTEPLPAINIGAAPEWMTARQREDWAFKRASSPAGVIKQVDRGTLQLSVVVDDILRDAAEGYARQKNKLTKRALAHLSTVRQFAPIAVRLNTELGLSPAARPRIQATPDPDAGRSELEKLLG